VGARLSAAAAAPAALDDEGGVKLRFIKTRNGDRAIEIRAKARSQ